MQQDDPLQITRIGGLAIYKLRLEGNVKMQCSSRMLPQASENDCNWRPTEDKTFDAKDHASGQVQHEASSTRIQKRPEGQRRGQQKKTEEKRREHFGPDTTEVCSFLDGECRRSARCGHEAATRTENVVSASKLTESAPNVGQTPDPFADAMLIFKMALFVKEKRTELVKGNVTSESLGERTVDPWIRHLWRSKASTSHSLMTRPLSSWSNINDHDQPSPITYHLSLSTTINY